MLLHRVPSGRPMNRMIVTGAVMLVVSLVVLVGGRYLLDAETRQVESAVRYDATQSPGARVVIEGKVADANPTLVQAFVNAARERYSPGVGSTKASWTARESFVQDLRIDVDGVGPVVVVSGSPCTRGVAVKTVDEPGAERLRVRGIERGAPFTAIGTLVSTSPLTLKAELTYADTKAGYLADLAVGARYLYITAGVIGLIGLALFARGWSKR